MKANLLKRLQICSYKFELNECIAYFITDKINPPHQSVRSFKIYFTLGLHSHSHTHMIDCDFSAVAQPISGHMSAEDKSYTQHGCCDI